MKQSWLVVMDIMATPNKANRWDLTKTVYATGSKSKEFAKKYSQELNEGRTLEDCVKQKKNFLNVVSIPWSQAREYALPVARKAIEEAQEYIKEK